MDEPLSSRPLRLPGDVPGPASVDRVERRAALLDVVADGIDDRGRALDRPRHRRLVPDVGAHDLDPAAPLVVGATATGITPPVPADPPAEGCALGVAHAHPHVVPRSGEALHDPAAEESRAPEYRYGSQRHRLTLAFHLRATWPTRVFS